MKKFNLSKAKEGHEVITKGKQSAKILLFDRSSTKFPLVVIIDNKDVYCYTSDGKFYFDKTSGKDLKLK